MGAVFHHQSDLGFVEGAKLMQVEVFASSEEETKFIGDDTEDGLVPGEISGDGDIKYIQRERRLELRAEHAKRRGGCVNFAGQKETGQIYFWAAPTRRWE